jgi:poly(3-hydroxybutyrate) depolymerase
VTGSGSNTTAQGTYYYYVPATYTDTTAWPLVVILHGDGGDGQSDAAFWEPVADDENFIVAAPVATNNYRFDPLVDEDVVANAMADPMGLWNIDTSRVYVVGFSSGSLMSINFSTGVGSARVAGMGIIGAPWDQSNDQGGDNPIYGLSNSGDAQQITTQQWINYFSAAGHTALYEDDAGGAMGHTYSQTAAKVMYQWLSQFSK